MQTIDDCRAAFVQAFKAYAQAGNAMRDLLIARDTGPAGQAFPDALAAHQHRLNQARDDYNRMRTVYVQAILQTLNLPPRRPPHSEPEGSHRLMEIRPPRSGPH